MPEQTTKLVFELFGRDHASPQFDKFGKKVQQTETRVHGLGGAVGKLAGAFAGLEVIDKATEFLKTSVEEAREVELQGKRTANVIATTGHVARVSVKDVDDLAASIQRKSTVDHEQVIGAENMLLTFKNIRNELGAGNKIFDRTTQAVTDLAATPFANMTSASKMLGKALNDPTKGMTALGRAGVTFSAAQQKQIKDLVKHNQLLKAQKIILKEVESQVGGAAASQATAGKRAALAWKDTEEELGKKLLPTIDKVEAKFADLVESGDLQKWAKEISSDLEPVVTVLEASGKAAGVVLHTFDGLPRGAKEALLLAGAVKILGGSLPALTTNSLAAEAGLLKTRAGLAGLAIKANAARIGAAGAGLALMTYADNVSTAGSSTNDLLKITGAAATGFAVRGPWGAAIGGGIEVLGLFGKKNHEVIGDVQALTDTLDRQTGQLTKNTRAMVVNELGKKGKNGKSVFQLATDVMQAPQGLVTDAALGNKAAMGEIANGIRAVVENSGTAGTAGQDTPAGRQALALADALGIERDRILAAKSAWQDHNNAVHGSIELNKLSAKQIREISKETKGIPKSAITKFTQPGYTNAVANAAEIAHRYHLQPKEVRTALRTLDYSTSQINAVLKLMHKADETTAHPKIRVTSNAAEVAAQAQRDINGVHGSSTTIRLASRKAGGGPIVGPGTGKSDDVPLWGSNGEHMLPVEDVAALGGQAGVLQFRRSLHQPVQSLASGGPVGRSGVATRAPGFDMDRFIREFARVSAQEHAKALSNIRLVTDRQGNTRLMAFGG